MMDLLIFTPGDTVYVLAPCATSHASGWRKISREIFNLILLLSSGTERYEHPCGCMSIVFIGVSSSDLTWLGS